MILNTIIHGVDVPIETNDGDTLGMVLVRLLMKTKNAGPPDRWEMRDEYGNQLSRSMIVGGAQSHIAKHGRIFVSLRAGAGG